MQGKSGAARRPNLSVSSALALLVASGLAMGGVSITTQPAMAQEAASAFDIPAGPLSTALNRLAAQSGLHIGFESSVVEGTTTAGLKGQYSAEDALGNLLTGTGLTYRFTNPKTVTVSAAAASDSTNNLSSGSSTELEPIVVNGGSGGVIQSNGYVGTSSATGAKTDTPFVETPQSVSSVTEKQLQDRNPQNLLDAISYTPGARVNAYGTDPRFDSFFVRGFNVTNTGVFRDNLRQPASGYGIFITEPYGLEGVSILRGPSSALYGATGAGGLYNVITKRPTEEAQHEVQFQLGTDQRYQSQFDFSGPVNDTDPFYYRLTGLGRVGDTEYDSVSDDRTYIAPAFTWKPDEDTRLTVLGEYSRSKSGGNPAYYNDTYGHVSEFEAGDTAFNAMDHQQARIGWEFEHSFDEVFTFRQNARYSWQDIDAKYVYAYNGAQHALDSSLVDRGSGNEQQRLDAFVIDNQLEAQFSTGPIDHVVLGGVDFTWSKYRLLAGYGSVDPLNTLVPNYGNYIATPDLTSRTDQRQVQTGIYLQDQLRYDAWTLTVGGRYDWVSTKTDNTDLTTSVKSSSEQDEGQFSGRVGLTYETEFGFVPYASLSTAFSPNIGYNSTTDAPFKSTTSTQEEVGVKYFLPDTNVMLSASVFNIDQRNGLFYTVIDGINTQVQRGKLRSQGVELEAVASLDNGLSFAASYTYTDLRILEGTAGTVDNFVSSVPFNMASLWAHYQLPEGTPLYGFGVGAGARFIGTSYGDDKNSIVNGSRVLFDASLSYDFAAVDQKYEGLSLQVNATNVFNRRDTTCTSGYCYLDPGRTVIGTLKYTW
nr:TonB-dependent siderophore receptor [Rhizobium sp. ACO-34A]